MTDRATVRELRMESRAKLNWRLIVGPPRIDGYHEIDTVFHELALADTLHFRTADSDSCDITGFGPDVPPEKNLITRAWRLMREHYGEAVGGLQVNAEKRLPQGGGLGGGSSNSAATLKAIRELYAISASDDELESLGAKLGSDVPFFVRGGCAHGRGRGEMLKAIKAPIPFHLVLVFPDQTMPTHVAYAELDQRPNLTGPRFASAEMADAVTGGDPRRVGRLIENDFEHVAAKRSFFESTRRALLDEGCIAAFLCGSGSTIAGLAAAKGDADEICARLAHHLMYKSCSTQTVAQDITF